MKYTDPKVADNVLNPQLIARINRDYMTYFQPGWKSTSRADESGHNQYNVLGDTKHINIDWLRFPHIRETLSPLSEAFDIVQQVIGEPRALIRAYTKSYNYGQDAYQHRDIAGDRFVTEDGKRRSELDEAIPGFETAIIYLTKDWQPDWYGSTLLYTDDDEIDAAIMPKFNRCAVFDSAQKHSTSPLSRICMVPKKIMVFNTMPLWQPDQGVDHLIMYLRDFPHGNKYGGLLEHLTSCFTFCCSRNFSRNVSLASLWHNVYGTAFYNEHKDVRQYFTREIVRGFIGPVAEELVHEYCSFGKGRTKKILESGKPDLIKIELANLQDQNVDGRYNQECIDLTRLIIDDYNACRQSAIADEWIERLEGTYIPNRNQ